METRAAIYVRVSTEEQAKDGYSIRAQINVLKLYAKLYKLKVVKVYSDEGLSGKDMNRQKLKELLDDAKNGMFDVLLVWKVSRLSRNLKNLLMIVDRLDTYGIAFISQSETFNTCTPVGRMTLQILGSIAEFERSTIIENIKLGLEQKAKNGEWLGGKVLGYDNINKKLVINEYESKIVTDIFENYNKDKSINTIIKYLYNNYQKRLHPSSIYRILKNPIYYGILRHKNKKEVYFVNGIHQPIISKELFDITQKKINSSKNNMTRTNQFILSGLIKCPYCNKSLVRYTTSKYRYYRCSTYHNLGREYCQGILINAKKIEDDVLNVIQNKINENTFEASKIIDTLNIDRLSVKKMELETKKKLINRCILEISLTDDKNIDRIFYNI